jgi:hypothetical protein
MSYLVCDKCGGHYELQPGESPEDFDLSCECGGKLENKESIELDDEFGFDLHNNYLDVNNNLMGLNKKSVIWIVGLIGGLIMFLSIHFLLNIPSIIAGVVAGLIGGIVMKRALKQL